MGGKLENKSIKFSEFDFHCMDILKNMYHIKPCDFIRMAFQEKLKRDIPKLRAWKKELKERTPFDAIPEKPKIIDIMEMNKSITKDLPDSLFAKYKSKCDENTSSKI